MEIIREMEAVEEQLDKANEMLEDSKKMVKKMQDIVFCMEAEAKKLREELEYRQSKLESEIHE
jgi:exonuclease VII small subunit